jgi:hypothetical protein
MYSLVLIGLAAPSSVTFYISYQNRQTLPNTESEHGILVFVLLCDRCEYDSNPVSQQLLCREAAGS